MGYAAASRGQHGHTGRVRPRSRGMIVRPARTAGEEACRDPMAVAITRSLVDECYPQLGNSVRIEGGALGPQSEGRVSFAARSTIQEIYDKDLLADYAPHEITLARYRRTASPHRPSRHSVASPLGGIRVRCGRSLAVTLR